MMTEFESGSIKTLMGAICDYLYTAPKGVIPMKVEFKGKYCNDTVEELGALLNTITVRRNDGKVVVLDRDESAYVLENGNADIVFQGVYEWGGGTHYPTDPKLYDGAELIDYGIEDDAPEDYDLEIWIGQKIVAW